MAAEQAMSVEHLDVVVVGAGLSGIGAGYYLQKRCPKLTYAILESREAIGGTWDLFRYPGIRSDSDMYTLGYAFKPWTHGKAIADGTTILNYVRETARENAIDQKIRFKTKVTRASWSTQHAQWTVEMRRGAAHEPTTVTCKFLFMCSGYYRYDAGYTPDIPGLDRFVGRVIHPQKWTDDIDVTGKRVVVIGSGATAVTLVPELAKSAAHVTMLQRSPTYVVSRPAVDPLANTLRQRLSPRLAYRMIRWRNVLRGMYIYQLSKRDPEKIKRLILGGVRMELGKDYDVAKHFTPRYKPWDQRMCLVPDGDLFATIRDGKATVATDTIETVTATGVTLRSGETLPADMIITATGLELQVLGNMEVVVDGARVDPATTLTYKGMMYSDVPNFALASGYTNASWTLKSDLTSEYVCRLLNHMKQKGYRQCVPHNSDPSVQPEPWVNFSSGYIQRAVSKFPKQGSKRPWRLYQNYVKDLLLIRHGKIEDGTLVFTR
jgi:monooxygenase